ncbi:MAG: DUF3592 domain-containing protein [Phycisphaerales bacterium]|nr:DUF3592 domain-containing protein [Phycisphaerales bacterium]
MASFFALLAFCAVFIGVGLTIVQESPSDLKAVEAVVEAIDVRQDSDPDTGGYDVRATMRYSIDGVEHESTRHLGCFSRRSEASDLASTYPVGSLTDIWVSTPNPDLWYGKPSDARTLRGAGYAAIGLGGGLLVMCVVATIIQRWRAH